MTLSLALSWAFQTLVAGLATIAFSIIFHTPRREFLLTGITGGVGWLVYLIAIHFGCGTVAASFLPRSPWHGFHAFSLLRTKRPSRFISSAAFSRWCRGRAFIIPAITFLCPTMSWA